MQKNFSRKEQIAKGLMRLLSVVIVLFAVIGVFFTVRTGLRYGQRWLEAVQNPIKLSDDTTYEYVTMDDPGINTYGFPFARGGTLNRLKINESYSTGVDIYAKHTAGGRIRFRTDSPVLHVCVEFDNIVTVPWSSLYGTAGLDVYNGDKWLATVCPYTGGEKNISQEIETKTENSIADITITLPTYASIKSLKIGIKSGSKIEAATPYTIQKPIVFYGSSITQGCSASRGSLGFPNLVADHFDADFINEGFSGSALGEAKVAKTLAEIDMSAFVMEYDHNAETPDDLSASHYNFYKIIRSAHPDIPIVLLSRISGGYSIDAEETAQRDLIIEGTYNKANAEGDTNIYFIDGCDVSLGDADMLADGKHPNDCGMRAIADAIIAVLDGQIPS